MKKRNLILYSILFTFVLFFAGCSDAKNNVDNSNLVSENIENNPAFNGNTVEINVDAFRFGFDPNIIEVNYGGKVILTAKSLDVVHGLIIEGYDQVDLYLDGFSSDSVTFIADKKGEFTFRCSIPCGEKHSAMKGKFIVK